MRGLPTACGQVGTCSVEVAAAHQCSSGVFRPQASHPLTGAGRRLLLRPVGTADRPSPAGHRPHSAGPVPKHKACGVHSAPGCHCAASAPPESDGPARWGRLHIPGAQPDQAGCWRYAVSCAACYLCTSLRALALNISPGSRQSADWQPDKPASAEQPDLPGLQREPV